MALTPTSMPTSSLNLPQSDAELDETWGLSALEALTWLGRDKRLVAKVTGMAALVALAVALIYPPSFSAKTTLIPPGSQQNSGSAALAALGQLGGLPSGLSAKTPDELYVALLKSDSVLQMLEAEFKLRERYDAKTFADLRRAMRDHVRISSDRKSGVISVEVDDKDPAFSAALANGHARALAQVLSRLAVSEAKQRRLFFEERLKETKETLVQAEQAFRQFQESSGVIVLDKQAEALIGSAASLRSQIAAREVQRKVLRTGATEQNPEVQRLDSELRALRSELSRLESSAGAAVNPGANPSVTDMQVGRIPEAAIDFVRARRELKLQETLLEGLVRQYEIARLDEAKEGPVLQQVDVALVPEAKSKPSRALIVLGGAVLGLLLSSLWVVARGLITHQQTHDAGGRRAWRNLRAAWAWRQR